MENDEMVEKPDADVEEQREEQKLLSRRDFLSGLRKWSAAAIGVALVGGALLPDEARAGWVNGRGAWVNGHSGGGWVNRATTWVNGGGGGVAWANRGVAWANRGVAWANRAGGGGGAAWVNRRGW
jgi:hypothetical protein